MPKHGWKWRTDQVRKLTELELIEMLDVSSNRRVSSRMARFIYENCIPKPDVFNLKARALDRIGWNEDAPWSRSFLWRELEKLKGEPLGDWCVIALSRSCTPDKEGANRFIDLYEDPSAHGDTRGSAIFGINSSIECVDLQPDKFDQALLMRIRNTCEKALGDQDNAYARAGACWLAQTLGGFEEELALLAEDRTPIHEGQTGPTVADHVD